VSSVTRCAVNEIIYLLRHFPGTGIFGAARPPGIEMCPHPHKQSGSVNEGGIGATPFALVSESGKVVDFPLLSCFVVYKPSHGRRAHYTVGLTVQLNR